MSDSSSSAVRKRKWDLDDSGNTAPPPPPPAPAHLSSLTPPPSRDNGSEDKSTDAAVAAVAKINAMLAAKGVAVNKGPDPLKLALPRKEETKKDLGGAEFEKDIDINDLKNRYMLTKGSTQKEIQAETGASITTRGMYYANREDATEKDPPLYLHIAANDQESLDKATERVNALIEIAKASGHPTPRNNDSPASASEESGGAPPPIPFNRNNPNLTPLNDRSERDDHDSRQNRDFHSGLRPGQIDCRVFVGLEVDRCFNVRAKLVGPGGAYVKHIQQETGARVQIKGKGSGFVEPATGREAEENLHIHIIHTQEGPLQAARELCENLVQTVREEFEKQQARFQPRQQGPAGGYGQHSQQSSQMSHGGYGPPPGTSGYDPSHVSGYQDAHYGYPGQQQGPPPPSSAPPPPPPGHSGASQQYQPPPPPSAPSSQPAPAPSSSSQSTTPTSGHSVAKAGEWDLAAYTAYYSQMYPNHPDYALYYAQQAMAQQQTASQTGAATATPQTQQQQQEWAAYYAYYGYSMPTGQATPTAAAAAPATTTTTPGSASNSA